jgi:transposase-like protein
MKRYKKANQESTKMENPIHHTLDQLFLLGAKRMLLQALDEEIETYRQTQNKKIYRNGSGKERHLTTPVGTIELCAPRLRETFTSNILGKYQRTSASLQQMFPDLYLHGLSSNDFQACFESVLGSQAPLSPSSILRMKASWEADYAQWHKGSLESEYLYVWVDGVYPKAGAVDEPMCLLVAVGVNRQGEKKLLALESGYRESYESWKELFRRIKKRGVQWLGLVIADGISSVWKALREIYPQTQGQRCWVHKMRNVLDKVPPKAQDEIKGDLQSIYQASSITDARKRIKIFTDRYQSRYPKAVSSLEEGLPKLLTYFQFPKEHWISIKTTNPLESMFSPVKNRTRAAKRLVRRDSALYLVFHLLCYQQKRLRKINHGKKVSECMDQMQKKQKFQLQTKKDYAA